VVVTDASLEESKRIDEICHSHQPPIAFVRVETRGVFASVFCDYGPSFTVYDVDGEHDSVFILWQQLQQQTCMGARSCCAVCWRLGVGDASAAGVVATRNRVGGLVCILEHQQGARCLEAAQQQCSWYVLCSVEVLLMCVVLLLLSQVRTPTAALWRLSAAATQRW
jgi:hypothetical protein